MARRDIDAEWGNVLEGFEAGNDLRYALEDAHADDLVLGSTSFEEEANDMGDETVRKGVFILVHVIGLAEVVVWGHGS